MTHDVFISYATEDQVVADAAVTELEGAGIRCWIAPRNIVPGTTYAAAITRAIEQAQVFVLVFSEHTNASRHVQRELDLAINTECRVIPFRVAATEPSTELRYYIGNAQWLDAVTPPLDRHVRLLAETIAEQLPSPEPEPSRSPEPAPAPATPIEIVPEPVIGQAAPAMPHPIDDIEIVPTSPESTGAGPPRGRGRRAAAAVAGVVVLAGVLIVATRPDASGGEDTGKNGTETNGTITAPSHPTSSSSATTATTRPTTTTTAPDASLRDIQGAYLEERDLVDAELTLKACDGLTNCMEYPDRNVWFRVEPCPEMCRLSLYDLAKVPLKYDTGKQGRVARGRLSDDLGYRCEEKPNPTDFELVLKNTKARYDDGHWYATQVNVTLTLEVPSRACGAASQVFAGTANY